MVFSANLRTDFSRKETSQKLNGLFISDGLQAILEAKHYCSMDMVFPFVCAFMNRVLWNARETYADDFAYFLLRPVAHGVRGFVKVVQDRS